jgi:hypothetical protein
MTAPILKWSQAYPGGRMLAQLGRVDAGAVFPPCGTPPDRLPWVWRFWLAGHPTPGALSPALSITHGRAKTEHAAKNALTAAVADWLRAAGLEQVQQ